MKLLTLILILAGTALVTWCLYMLLWLFYRYILHPDYRWEQRGNICYDDARAISWIVVVAIYIIAGIFYLCIDSGKLIIG